MVQRYAHLSPDTLRRAVMALEKGMKKVKNEKLARIGE